MLQRRPADPVGVIDMRVLNVIDSLDASGGAERSLAALAPELISLGIELHVAYLRERPKSLINELRGAGVAVHSLAGHGKRVADTMRVRSLANTLRPDLVHTTLFEADQAGRIGAYLARRPVVSSFVNDAYNRGHISSPGMHGWKVKAAQTTDMVTARLAPVRFHAITAHVAKVMAARLRIARDKIDVVPRGRDPAVLGMRSAGRAARARRELGIDERQPLVVAVGRQVWQKGHDVLLEATPALVQKWPDLIVVVAGRPGPQSDALQQVVAREQLDGHVRILGFRDDVAELLCAADVFAFPSRWEGLGSTLLEAMALEAPIVASDIPAVREVVAETEARFVPPDEPRALADAISDLLDDRVSAGRQAAAARERFLTEFTIERSAKGMVAFYERSLSREPAS